MLGISCMKREISKADLEQLNSMQEEVLEDGSPLGI